jgi:hypothetical protein
MRKFLSLLAVCFTISFLPGCEQLGLNKASSIEEKIAYGYSSIASIRSTTADLLTAKRIQVEDAKMVQAMADNARTSLDIAKGAVQNGRPKDAQAALNLATKVLVELQVFLTEKEQK